METPKSDSTQKVYPGDKNYLQSTAVEGGVYSYGGWRLQLWKVESTVMEGGVYSYGGWRLQLWRVETTVMEGGAYASVMESGVYACSYGGWSLQF